MSLIASTAISWTFAGVAETMVETVNVCAGFTLNFTDCFACFGAVADSRWTVGRISQAVDGAPIAHSQVASEQWARHADLVAHNQREDVVLGIGTIVAVVEQEGILLLGDEDRRSSGSGARVDADVGAVAERLGGSAADGLRSVGALAPHVAGVVSPLDDALRARHARRQPDLVAEHLLLLRLGRNFEADAAGVGDEKRVALEALLRRLLEAVVVGTQVHLEPSQMVRRQLNLHLDFLSCSITSRYNAFAIISAGFMGSRRRQMICITANAALS